MLKGERLLLGIIKEVNLKIESKLLKWVYCLSVGLFLYLATVGQAEIITNVYKFTENTPKFYMDS